MARALLLAAVLAAATTLSATSPADAGDRRTKASSEGAAHPQSSAYRGARVKGFVARRGGYSYSAPDTINTYGDARTRYGGVSSYRDPFLDRQTNAGPFDHGFFFDSGIGPRGGDSPYMN